MLYENVSAWPDTKWYYYTSTMLMVSIVLTLFTVIFGGYLWLKQRARHWENHRVPHLKPNSLVFGNEYDTMVGNISTAENSLKQYRSLAPHRYGGYYHFLLGPILYIRDPELIKNVLIKDFHYFYNRMQNMANKEDPLTQHLFNLSGEEWKTMRNKLSPTFTSGKMKVLFGLMKECVEGLEKIIEENANDGETVNVKELMARYATDVISSCAFGLEANSLQDPNSEFRLKGKEFTSPSLKMRITVLLFVLSPALFRLLRLKLVPQKLNDFFVNLISDSIEYRRRTGVVRHDFLNILMNLQYDRENEETKNYDIGFITAQCFIFFFAGFDTSANALSFALYELAAHENVQKRLQAEVDGVLKKHDGRISYESLQELQYMDQVFNETARLYPALPILFRTCTENYRIPKSDYVVKKGDAVFIPVYGLHRDPQYYPNPDAFDPENFSEEAKAARPACCFLPFGDGPKNCIGSRFGIMQVKLALTMIMKGFTVTVSPEMKLPIELAPISSITTSKNDILLKFNKRNTTSYF